MLIFAGSYYFFSIFKECMNEEWKVFFILFVYFQCEKGAVFFYCFFLCLLLLLLFEWIWCSCKRYLLFALIVNLKYCNCTTLIVNIKLLFENIKLL